MSWGLEELFLFHFASLQMRSGGLGFRKRSCVPPRSVILPAEQPQWKEYLKPSNAPFLFLDLHLVTWPTPLAREQCGVGVEEAVNRFTGHADVLKDTGSRQYGINEEWILSVYCGEQIVYRFFLEWPNEVFKTNIRQ